MVLKVLLDENAKLPIKAHNSDAGFDMFSRNHAVVKAKSFELFDTGVHIDIPEGYVGFLKSKSGLNCKHSLVGEGVIDAGYIGSIVVKLYNHGTTDYIINAGDKISQIVFLPIPEIKLEVVEDLKQTERDNAGFGSTGR